ncbi:MULTISPECIES: hypothetical protein [Streptomyces]|uniref:Uncharacterized protein n=2 Tax=Streptomyces TaxID=1883 RepID=A0A117IWA5_9ACTN|nr:MULTISPECIES: hypothetical protein [Streptomyces]KUH38388.1 hypothetical protein ATE80_13040 [Streptomyces kanasensis]UUS30833.1 hypothetical protein NRO40_08285 [Streptomyces changanensis]
MARIRMLVSVAGAGFSWQPGQVVDLPGAEAAKWADGVRAVLIRDEPMETPERAAGAETAARPRTRRTTRKG